MVELCVNEWRQKFGKLQGGKEIVSLTGETSADLRLLEKGDVIVCTPTQVFARVTLFSLWKLILLCCSGMSFHEGGGKGKMFRTWDFSLPTKFRWLEVK